MSREDHAREARRLLQESRDLYSKATDPDFAALEVRSIWKEKAERLLAESHVEALLAQAPEVEEKEVESPYTEVVKTLNIYQTTTRTEVIHFLQIVPPVASLKQTPLDGENWTLSAVWLERRSDD